MQITKNFGLVVLSLSFIYGAMLPLARADFDYPELSVTPRASDRLEAQAAKDGDSRFAPYRTYQISGAMTLLASVAAATYKNDYSVDLKPATAYLAGFGVGAGWLAVTSAMAMYYDPYGSAAREISPLPKKSTREMLTRERLAEERLEAVAKLSRKLKWMSFVTNAGASAYMLGTTSGLGTVMCGLSAVTSLAPLIFKSSWEEIADAQADYKKRIYSPVASLGYVADSRGGLAPSLNLTLNF